MSLNASELAAKTLRDYAEYVDSTEPEWIDYYPTQHLDFQSWQERENPQDPDVDA